VEDIESLARIAGHYERSILYEVADYGEVFWVTDESGQFRYVVPAEQAPEQSYAAAGEPEAQYGPAEAADGEAPTAEHWRGGGLLTGGGAPA
jgi:hypothetical protein